MRWSEFQVVAPQLAELGLDRFNGTGVALIGTLRKDGSPRISPIEPFIVHGQLLLGMRWHTTKALDLLRDPRCVIHSAVSSVEGSEGEFKLRGRALEISDRQTWEHYRQAFSERWGR